MGATRRALVVICTAALCALAVFLVAPIALADDTELGVTGGTITAVSAGDVRLDAETVQAVCFGSFAEYRVDFRFVNDGPARRVRLGFPFSAVVDSEHGTDRPFGFQAWQGGRPLPVRIVGAAGHASGRSQAGYFVHSARFPHGATMITVSYLSQSSGTAMARVGNDFKSGFASWYEYWLHTGATWKGAIGSAVVRYSLADTFSGTGMGLSKAKAGKGVPVTTPGWTTPLPRTYEWRLREFEPAASTGEVWWRAQNGSDVFLGFARSLRPVHRPKWTQSGAGGRPAEGGVYNELGSPWLTSWPGDGGDPWVQATFRRPVHIRELRIVGGNIDYVNAFQKYGRPKTLTAAFSDGSTATLHLKDASVLQRFPVDVTTQSVRLTIDDVYPGTDYPAVALATVEFGGARAPGYARFADLLRDDAATGRLTAWAGRLTRGVKAGPGFEEYQEQYDSLGNTGGTLIGVDQDKQFRSKQAPYRRPSTLGAITKRNSRVRLPSTSAAGAPSSVDSLSTWTFDVHYPRGIELLVNTKAPRQPSVVAELAHEQTGRGEYSDGRRLAFEVSTVGGDVVGYARAGTITAHWTGDSAVHLPAQVFWRDRDVTYHLYARSSAVSLADLKAVARGMLVASPAKPAVAVETRGARPWWGAVLFVGALVVLAVVLARRRTA